MAARPTWQGHLRLSLVTCPVALYSATSSAKDVHFNLLHKDTHNRIKMVTTDPELGPVERSDLVKGYEVEKGRYVILTEDEIKGVRLESTRTIDIERFVDADEIDRLYWNDPFFLVPDGALAQDAYAVIREAMRASNRIALGRVVMHTRERLLAIEPRECGLVAYTLRTYEEVRKPEDFFKDIPIKQADAKMVDIAEKIIEQSFAEFEPEEFKDRYEEALKELIARKEKGQGKVKVEEPEDSNVIDLMEALRKSLGGASPKRAAAAAKPAAKSASKPAASKSAPAKAAAKPAAKTTASKPAAARKRA